jgi:hemolysin D
VVSAKRTQTIAVPDVGTIRQIRVVDGQAVRKGDVLVEMDTGVVDSVAGQARQSLAAALGEVARHRALLDSYRSGRMATPVFDERVPASLAQVERQVVQTAWLDHAARLSQLEAEVRLRQAQVESAQALLGKSQAMGGLAAEKAADYRRLKAEGFLSEHAVRDQERERMGHDLDVQRLQSTVEETRRAVAEVQARRQVLAAEAYRTSAAALAEAEHRAAAARQDVARADALGRRLQVVAPVDGVVQQLRVFTVGGVVKEAQELMNIVQADEGLELEVMIRNTDIGFVRVGQPATLKFEAFPYTKYGTLQGEVRVVARDAVADERQGLLYPARVSIRPAPGGRTGEQIMLQQGLVATADVKTGERRVIEYFLSPILRYQREALRER